MTSPISKEIIDLGKKFYADLKKKKYPSIAVPSRATNNIIFDKKLNQYVIGDKTTIRSSGNLAGAKPMANLSYLANLVHNDLLSSGKSTTMRDVYYDGLPVNHYKDQAESNGVIFDMEAILGHPREDFNILPDNKNYIFGDLVIKYLEKGFNGQESMKSSPDGKVIGHHLARRSKIIKSGAKMIIVTEKSGTFTRCVEDGLWEKYKALIVNTNGQASRNARYLLSRLARELKIPIYIFTDADPYGEHIARVLIAGSANSAHIGELVIPKAFWCGVWASDITKYSLPTITMKDVDIAKCQNMLKDVRYLGDDLWRHELKEFARIKKKAELEAFSSRGLTYITDEYIPEKIKMVKRGKSAKPKTTTRRKGRK